MFVTPLRAAALAAAVVALAGCTSYDRYGGGPRYAGGYYSDGYGQSGGRYQQPSYGWYGDYYYPGTGVHVYDRDRRAHRWNNSQQRYWEARREIRQDRRAARADWRDFDRREARRDRRDYRRDRRDDRRDRRRGRDD